MSQNTQEEPLKTLAGRRFLLIEDDDDIAALLQLHLGEQGAQVQHESDGVAGLACAIQQHWDLLLLDLSLPGCDGLDICREVTARIPGLPIVMLTARVEEQDRIEGLDIGADDYLVKPFAIGELIARIKAILRRMEQPREPHPVDGRAVLRVGDIELDEAGRTVTIAERPVELTAREFDLLRHFMLAPGTVFRRMDLLEAVWDRSYAGYLHTVNSHINRLRGKIEPDTARPRYITTVWGVGYKLCP